MQAPTDYPIWDKAHYGVYAGKIYHRYVAHVEDIPDLSKGIWINRDGNSVCDVTMEIHQSNLILG